jgi:glycosyltransferase involved in cell wall biosynthesis
MKENICFITASYPDYGGSYRGSFIKKMVDLLKKDGYRISVVTPRIFDKSKLEEFYEGERIYRFPFFSENKLLIEYEKIPILRMISYLLSGIFKSYKVIKKDKCRLVHAHWVIPTGLIGILAGKMFGIPTIVTALGSDILVLPQKSYLLRMIVKFVLKNAYLITSDAQVLTEKMLELGACKEKLVPLVLGVDSEEVDPEVESIEQSQNKPLVISVRNLTSLYNIELLIKCIPFVVKEIPEVKFIIAGDGSEKENLEKLHRELKLERYVDFVGSLSHSELLKSLASSTIYVSTSLSDSTSLSLLEAMYCGVFPVVTDITANREWIKDGENGFLVPLDKERILGEKIVKALRDRNLRENARKKNRNLIEERGLWSSNIRKLESYYLKLLRRGVNDQKR